MSTTLRTAQIEQRLSEFFEDHYGSSPVDIRPLAGDGSARRYLRLYGADGESALGAFSEDREENRAFLSFSRTFRALELPVPEVYGADEVEGVWLEEDLGDATLFDVLSAARQECPDPFPERVIPLFRDVVRTLPLFQVRGGEAIDFDVAYPRAAFDRQSILWDLNYFKYHFLKLAHVPFNEQRLERDFGRLVRFLLKADSDHFLYRDFQTRNVMIRAGQPWFIDYQGGRRGALQYDIASLLYDAKADLPQPLREGLLVDYLDALEPLIPIDRDRFMKRYPGFVLIRILQAMGAFGYRGFFERKPRFLQSVPYAARNVEVLLEAGMPLRAPELEAVLQRIVDRWALPRAEPAEAQGLTVQLGSFRFAGGYPEDSSGHGGGFVFDCRGLPNPGREREYRTLTGLDAEVIRFLEEQPECAAFYERARALVDAHVQDFQQRGFSCLTVNFGCAGGQHRSVYFVERLARHLRDAHPDLTVQVTHRERPDWPHMAAGAQLGEV